MDAEELDAWLRLLHTEGVGPATARTLLAHFGMPQQVLAAGYGALIKVVPERVAQNLGKPAGPELQALIERSLAWQEQEGNTILTLADPAYPSALLQTPDPPSLLYCIGNTGLLAQPGLAMVGSRNASVQGAQDARAFARSFARASYTVISGLALGIDAAAHEGALQAQGAHAGSTIAVIGTGADIVYPARNRALAHRIAKEGLIISEYHLGTGAIAANFPRRNRIISGLSRGVLVVEAAAQSGSLITARLAMDQGREVFAIPGSIHSPLSKGCHKLIRQGAKLVESAEDVLEELRPLGSPAVASSRAGANDASNGSSSNQLGTTAAGDSRLDAASDLEDDAKSSASDAPLDEDMQSLLDAMGHAPVDVDSLSARTGLSVTTLAMQLLQLEMQGRVEALPGARWRRLQ